MRMKNLFFALAACAMLASCAPKNGQDNELTMVAGTYTDTGSEGLYSFSFNQETGEFSLLDSCRVESPSYLTFSADGSKIYAISEIADSLSCVTALTFNKTSGAFSVLNSEPTNGSPCYIATNGKIAVTANYGGGSMSVLPIADDGTVRPLATLIHGNIGGPDSLRQNLPHIHCTEFSPDGNHLYVSDFSADQLLCFNVSNSGYSISPMTNGNGEPYTVPVRTDYGPRHIVFDKSGNHLYLVGELSGCITVFDRDTCGFLSEKQIIDADPYDGRASADIHISPDGHFLYSSNRRQGDGIAIFAIDADSGILTELGYQPTAMHPRHFNITPNGKYVLVSCRDSNRIEIYNRDIKTGFLSPSKQSITLQKPVCVQFAP